MKLVKDDPAKRLCLVENGEGFLKFRRPVIRVSGINIRLDERIKINVYDEVSNERSRRTTNRKHKPKTRRSVTNVYAYDTVRNAR